jgi:hypothetical protein
MRCIRAGLPAQSPLDFWQPHRPQTHHHHHHLEWKEGAENSHHLCQHMLPGCTLRLYRND